MNASGDGACTFYSVLNLPLTEDTVPSSSASHPYKLTTNDLSPFPTKMKIPSNSSADKIQMMNPIVPFSSSTGAKEHHPKIEQKSQLMTEIYEPISDDEL
jgi:hypothetical protein